MMKTVTREWARFLATLAAVSTVSALAGWYGMAALFAMLSGCGTEVQTPPGIETKQGDLLTMRFGKYGASLDSAKNYIQQVPLNTPVSDHLSDGFGTFYSYPVQPTAIMRDGANYGAPSTPPTQNDHIRLDIGSITTPPNLNLLCEVFLGKVLRTPTTMLAQWFKAPYPGFGGDTRTSTQGSSQPGSSMPTCRSAGATWLHAPSNVVSVYYWPSGNGDYTGEPTTSAPSTFSLRVDIDLPESNVTNRYFYYFVKTGP